jgi:hypothetical protein
MSKTIPGGYYIGVNGLPHDAEGKPIVGPAPEVAVVVPTQTMEPLPAEAPIPSVALEIQDSSQGQETETPVAKKSRAKKAG